MNRLVIIGNGFDLAHGLPTGYCDFINDYWLKVFNHIKNQSIQNIEYKDDFISLVINFGNQHSPDAVKDFKNIYSFKDLMKFLKTVNSTYNYTRLIHSVTFSNKFFEKINLKHSIQNWVDIENEYFKILKSLVTPSQVVNNIRNIRQLNEEFDQVKNLLENYLNEKVYNGYDFTMYNDKINEICKLFNVMNRFTDWKKFREEFSNDDIKINQQFYDKLKDYNTGHYDITEFIKTEKMEVENLFLNFNYTPTVDSYIDAMRNTDMNYYGNNRLIQIHGRLNDSGNKINFGFGDEMDADYKKIESKDDNEYLQNIKSFQYMQNSNYRKLLDFVEKDKFQVYIMGHSCGLSDRILLNTIFEHQNCRSIKVFFYQNEDKDNFTEIIQNISRHFNKKKMMREKIVNKSLCQPLPQEVRFKQKNNGS